MKSKINTIAAFGTELAKHPEVERAYRSLIRKTRNAPKGKAFPKRNKNTPEYLHIAQSSDPRVKGLSVAAKNLMQYYREVTALQKANLRGKRHSRSHIRSFRNKWGNIEQDYRVMLGTSAKLLGENQGFLAVSNAMRERTISERKTFSNPAFFQSEHMEVFKHFGFTDAEILDCHAQSISGAAKRKTKGLQPKELVISLKELQKNSKKARFLLAPKYILRDDKVTVGGDFFGFFYNIIAQIFAAVAAVVVVAVTAYVAVATAAVSEAALMATQAVTQAVGELAVYVPEVGQVADILNGNINAVEGSINGNLNDVVEVANENLTNAGQWLGEQYQDLGKTLDGKIDEIVNGGKSDVEKFDEWVGENASNLKENVDEATQKIGEADQKARQEVPEKAKEWVEDVEEWLKKQTEKEKKKTVEDRIVEIVVGKGGNGDKDTFRTNLINELLPTNAMTWQSETKSADPIAEAKKAGFLIGNMSRTKMEIHLPSCTKLAWLNPKHVQSFPTLAEGKAQGLDNCHYCLGDSKW